MPNEIERLEQGHVNFDKVDKEIILAVGVVVVIILYVILKVVF